LATSSILQIRNIIFFGFKIRNDC